MQNIWILSVVALMAAGTGVQAQSIDFGTDSSEWANDGECDDARFMGAGMTTTPLIEDDVMADASDCAAAFAAGQLQVRGVANGTVDFGNDSGEWANDNECDDMRFQGAGMTTTPLIEDDIMTDATDCMSAYQAGRLQLVGINP